MESDEITGIAKHIDRVELSDEDSLNTTARFACGIVSHDVEMVPFTEHLTRIVGYGANIDWRPARSCHDISGPVGAPGRGGVEVSKPPWFVLWIYGIENLRGLQAVLFATATIAIVLVIVSFLDRVRSTDPTRRKLILGLVFVGYIIIFALTVYAALRPPQTHLMG